LGPRNSGKIGALFSAEGALLNLFVPLTAVRGLGTLASNFYGSRNGVPPRSPYFNHRIAHTRPLCRRLQSAAPNRPTVNHATRYQSFPMFRRGCQRRRAHHFKALRVV